MREITEYSPLPVGNKNTRLGRTEAIMLNNVAEEIHRLNKKWWVDINKPCGYCNACGYVLMPDLEEETECPECCGHGYAKLDRNVGEMLMLAVSELSEALEYHRKGNGPDDKLPNRRGLEVELADCVIRIFDLASGLGYDIGGAIVDKCEYNQIRVDHTIQNRLGPGGKMY